MANTKTIKKVLEALGGESAELSTKRVGHILNNRGLFGKTVDEMASGVLDHVSNTKYVKSKNPLKEFGKRYSDDVTDFAHSSIKSTKDASKIIEEGISVNGNKKALNLNLDNVSNVNLKNNQNYINIKNDYKKTLEAEIKNTENIAKANKKLQGLKPDVDNISKTRNLKKNRFDDKKSYMKWSQGQKYDDAIDAFKNKDYNNPLLKQLTDEGIDLKKLNTDNLQALRQETINKVSASDMKMMDWMGYHKVPQKATGVVCTAWLVNKMAAGGGQQTNSQLYGQNQY